MNQVEHGIRKIVHRQEETLIEGGKAEFAINDAPAHDEIVVASATSIGGRPNHRLGDRCQDLQEPGSNEA